MEEQSRIRISRPDDGWPTQTGACFPQIHSRGFQIDLLLRELAKQRIGFLLFLERLLEERCCIADGSRADAGRLVAGQVGYQVLDSVFSVRENTGWSFRWNVQRPMPTARCASRYRDRVLQADYQETTCATQ